MEVKDGVVQGVVRDMQTYFGRGFHPDGKLKSLAEFSAELKALTTDDKVQLCGGIRDGSLDYKAA